ncbi:IclR family transcriptional regulator [Microbacterium sp. BWT-B31]|uniref:IclR family transcriptional regulator n=1 Tax=Microbacterium sp. BWT-B31 TaxID=3232072 RepID=UPI00352738C1
MPHPAEKDNPIAMVDRIAAIINCVAEQSSAISMSEVARRTGLPKSTTSRIVHSLLPHGLLEIVDDELVLGLRFFELGELASRPRTLRRLTYAHMEGLRRVTGNSVHLAVLDGRHVVYIEILRSRATPALPSRVGGRVPAHATAVGKALLAFSPPEVTERIIEGGLEAIGPRTITDPDRLRAALWRIRASGIATEQEESGRDSACVAAPILVGESHEPIAAISVSGVAAEMDIAGCERAVRSAVDALREQAALLPRRGRTM